MVRSSGRSGDTRHDDEAVGLFLIESGAGRGPRGRLVIWAIMASNSGTSPRRKVRTDEVEGEFVVLGEPVGQGWTTST